MIVLLDADSLVYSCSYGCETSDDARDKFDTMFRYIVSDIEDMYNVISVIVYHGSTNNFRVHLDKNYKANRKHEKPEFYHQLSEYVSEVYDVRFAVGCEVDDLIADDWKWYMELGQDVCIASIDKDYMQLPALIYNYNIRKRGFIHVSEEDARHNFWVQMVTGDSADNVNYLKGKGKAYAEKLFKGSVSDFSYFRRCYTEFIKEYGKQAKNAFKTCYRLLKIGDIDK